ncbi:dihydrofolate reductase [Lysinibacter cavernae]|uniref:Dihydrofolate reductase n=1 Tax=Lysinibacter cavernae TaxID=1640652 RepID=A0A7X5TTM3_9MICO|nr:dihydrofolate reductase [Lysinibacter cavernae]NIH54355.1 dihydrofolate reductase [Lysinibacter cavernae]
MTVSLIWAQARDRIIGRDGVMPWHLPEDLAHFKQLTHGHPVIMGRKTWDSLPPRFRPLAGRRNIVITRRDDWQADGAEVANSLEQAIELATGGDSTADIWVIGGGEIYRQAMAHADRLEVTVIDVALEGDTRGPLIDGDWLVTSEPADGWHISTKGMPFRFDTYRRPAAK